MRKTAFELANARGEPLRGDLRVAGPPGPRPVVVICHGFKGFKDWGFFPFLGERLAAAGFAAVSFNFSGSGIGPDLHNFTEMERFAADTVSRQVDDLGLVLDAVVTGDIGAGEADPSRLGLLGHSRGGGTALVRAREDRRVGALVTWSAVASFVRWTERELEEWRRRGWMEFLNTRTQQMMRMNWSMVEDYRANAARFDLPAAAAALRVPWLLVHGDQDLSVRVDEGRTLFAAADQARSELLVVPGTGHTFGVEHPWKGTTPALERAIERSISWMQASLQDTSQRSPR
jgi:pimeloyl-ACP methyl ester carboxylesterase